MFNDAKMNFNAESHLVDHSLFYTKRKLWFLAYVKVVFSFTVPVTDFTSGGLPVVNRLGKACFGPHPSLKFRFSIGYFRSFFE